MSLIDFPLPVARSDHFLLQEYDDELVYGTRAQFNSLRNNRVVSCNTTDEISK